MTTINDIKVNLASKIFTINDLGLLKSIGQHIDTVHSENQNVKTLPYHSGITEICQNLTADQVFEEQGNKSITYKEIEEITKDIEWEHSLEEMLAALD